MSFPQFIRFLTGDKRTWECGPVLGMRRSEYPLDGALGVLTRFFLEGGGVFDPSIQLAALVVS